MPLTVDQPYNVYREQLSSLYHGTALWEPNPMIRHYERVSIGDVGYVHEGFFYRMFNVTLPWNDPSNATIGVPEQYKTLVSDPFTNIREATLDKGEYYSRHGRVSKEDSGVRAAGPDEGVAYKSRGQGALLFLPYDGHRSDVIRTKVFEDYIRDNVVTWFNWARNKGMGVERMEDLILVSGCTFVTSWAAAAFVDSAVEAEISLTVQPFNNGGAHYTWSKIHNMVAHHNSHSNPNPPWNQCVFIRGFRAKRVFLWTRLRAAAEPLPDDPYNRRDDEILVTGVPDAPKYCDPLIGVLNYIAEKCPEDCAEDTIAIAHDDDLQLIENVENMTASTVKSYLHERDIPVLIENGAAILHEDDPPVPEEAKAIFFASAELGGEPVPLVVHPVLAKYLLRLEFSNPDDHDYDLPKEETTSPAVAPPMLSLLLENHQGYPQAIRIQPSDDSPGIGVTVQDVLRTLHEDLKKSLPRRQLGRLSDEERVIVNDSFKERCTTEEDLSKGPCRFDHLGVRNRLQILPKYPIDDESLLPTMLFPVESFDDSKAAGPSRIR
ncbi:hypothetical protein F5148DRAFT_1333231 [Russula earlei]|uniref:Uncharacterized protein n=1 Tax=Russula earlei TaxID=71964 RepID=A0ACC0UGI7_9AGAM|nr:hypothetical protein F5148DRAFT_1333231 [Russula earlei]